MNRIISHCLIIVMLTLVACGSESNSKINQEETTSEKPVTEQKLETPETKVKSKTILFFGNSLTAGAGIDLDDAFSSIIGRRIDSLQLGYTVINSGISGETTAGGLSRIDWILEQQIIDIFILELGGNDGLRGVDPQSSTKNLQGIIDKVKSKYPKVTIVLAGMEAPPNMGDEFTGAFRGMFPKLAKTNSIALIPFILDKVAGVAELNQTDGIHPTEEGHRIVAENIWNILEPLL